MTSDMGEKAQADVLLEMRGLRIEGQSHDEWHEIIKGIDITLDRGEVLGLIGESGAGKSTAGLAAMGFARPGCRISGGSIMFDGIDLMAASEEEKRKLRGVRIAYVAQSAAASFNPAHRLIEQFAEIPVEHHKSSKSEAEDDAKIEQYNYQATKEAIERAVAGLPTVQEVLAQKNAEHPFAANVS